MPTTSSSVFIPALLGFRPTIIEWEPPTFGSNGEVKVISVRDKYPPYGAERYYDVESIVRNNDMTAIVGKEQAKVLAANDPPKPKFKPKPRAAQTQLDLLPD